MHIRSRYTLLTFVLFAIACGGGSSSHGPGLAWVKPATDVTVDKSIDIELAVHGAVTGPVLLKFRDTKTFAITELVVPSPYRESLDTTVFANDPFEVFATATLDGMPYQTDKRTITIDHTPTTVVTSGGFGGTPLVATFSKAILAGDLSKATVNVSVYPYQPNEFLDPVITKLPATVTVSGSTMTVTLSMSLLAPCIVSLEPGQALTDAVGQPLPVFEWAVEAIKDQGGMFGQLDQRPALARDGQGRVVMAWLDRTTGTNALRVHQQELDGTWNEIGATMLNAEPNNDGTGQPSIAIDKSGNPIVAWAELTYATGRSNVFAARWNGAAFIRLPIEANEKPTYSGYNPSITVDDNDQIVVYFTEFFNDGVNLNDSTYVKRWNGTTWDKLLTGPGGTIGHSLMIRRSPAGALVIARDYVTPTAVDVQTYNEGTSTWTLVGTRIMGQGGAASGSDVEGVDLHFDHAGEPVLAYTALLATSKSLELVHLVGGQWQTLAPSLLQVYGAFVRLDAQDRPTVIRNLATTIPESHQAMAPDITTAAVFGDQWNGTEWVPLDGMFQDWFAGGSGIGAFGTGSLLKGSGSMYVGDMLWDGSGAPILAVGLAASKTGNVVYTELGVRSIEQP